jgi:hypothetical protein
MWHRGTDLLGVALLNPDGSTTPLEDGKMYNVASSTYNLAGRAKRRAPTFSFSLGVCSGVSERSHQLPLVAHPLSARSMALRLWHNVTILFLPAAAALNNGQADWYTTKPAPQY